MSDYELTQDEEQEESEGSGSTGVEGADFESMTIAKLRSFANLYRIPFARDSTKKDIISAIQHKLRGQTIAKPVVGDSRPGPGFARIKMMRDNAPRARNIPIYVQVNGRTCTIPRGVEVDVPEKIVECLRHSTHPQIMEDTTKAFNDPKRVRIEAMPSYPFEVLDRTPGPDPWPGYEVHKKSTYGPREKFWKLFGRWPKRGEVTEAIKGGFITLSPLEVVPDKEQVRGKLSDTGK